MPYANKEIKRIKNKEYRETHKEELKLYFQNHWKENKDKLRLIHKERHLKNRERNLQKQREYYANHLEERKQYNIENKEKANKQFMIRYRERMASDPIYKIRRNLRSRLAKALKGIGHKSQKTLDLLGCPIEQLKEHIEKQFKEGMSWDNYGKKIWHIDHKIPCAAFDLTKPEEQCKCFHYSNLQPLWARENLEKGDNFSLDSPQ